MFAPCLHKQKWKSMCFGQSKFRTTQILNVFEHKQARRVNSSSRATPKSLSKSSHRENFMKHRSTAASCYAICSQPNAEFHSFHWIPIQSSYTWMENINYALPRSQKYHNGNFSSSTGTKQEAKNTSLGKIIIVNIRTLK